MSLSIEERLAGAVWDHLVGDAMGVPYDFSAPGSIDEVRWGASGTYGQPPGTWSDDGGLMLALLDSLLTAGFDVEDQGRRCLAWRDDGAYRPGSMFDIGNATTEALDRLVAGAPAAQAGGAAEGDNGNGSLMRILPVALTEPDLSTPDLVERAASASAVTHAHPRAQVTCAVYCALARRLLRGEEDLPAVLASAFDDVRDGSDRTLSEELKRLAAYAGRTGSGYVLDTFWSAWSVFASTRSYQESVEAAIRLGNDTDTTACVAGGLAGLRWGVSGIPETWLTGMRGRDIAQPLVDRLLERWGSVA